MLGHSSGMKLIRVRTREVVAVYANVNLSVKKTGKMSFLMSEKDGLDLGYEFQLMAVMSVLSLLVERRRGARANFAGACAIVCC